MLSKKLRLTKQDVARLYKKGQVLREKFYFVRFAPNRASTSRFSVVVSKKLLSSAVSRNRLRRITYQKIGDLSEKIEAQRKLDLSINFKAVPKDDELEGMIGKTFQTLGLIK